MFNIVCINNTIDLIFIHGDRALTRGLWSHKGYESIEALVSATRLYSALVAIFMHGYWVLTRALYESFDYRYPDTLLS